jgi:hypothetical protein
MAIADITTQAPTKGRSGPPCAVCSLLGRLPDSERDALLDLLTDKDRRYTELSRDLAAEGHDLSAYSIGWHVRGDCAARTKLR